MLDRRLEIIIGKGGVGRTTVAAALALASARRGARTLLLEIHGRDRATRMLGHPPIGPTMAELGPSLFVANVTPSASLEEYVLSVVRSPRVYRRLFGSRMVAGFIDGLPALDELMMIGKVRHHAEETKPGWERVIVDAPATGNGLYFLGLPELVLRVVRGGPLGYYARKQRDLLRDPSRTAVHVVTLAEEMPVAESFELCAALEGRLSLPLGSLVVNRVREPALDPRSRALLARLPEAHGEPAVRAGRWAVAREELQDRYLSKLSALQLPQARLPNLEVAELGPDELDRLSRELEAQSDAATSSTPATSRMS